MTRILANLESRGVVNRRRGSGIYVSPMIGRPRVGLVFGRNVFGQNVSPVYSVLLDLCQHRAREGNERFSFYIDMPDGPEAAVHPDLLEDVRGGRLQGLMFTSRGSAAQREWRDALPLPHVSFLPTYRFPGVVGLDYADMVRAGLESLSRRGCRRVGYLSVLHRQNPSFTEDVASFDAAARRLGLKGIVWRRGSSDDMGLGLSEQTFERWASLGRLAVRELWQNPSPPDGLLISDDAMASGALAELSQRGVRLGADLHVASHANAGTSTLASFAGRIVRLEFEPAEISSSMFSLLESRMAGRRDGPGTILVRCKVIETQASGQPVL
jgi:DNA-binding LacI/PurR family transcriptional regulator